VWAVVEGEGDVPGVTDTSQAGQERGAQGRDERGRGGEMGDPGRGRGADERPFHPATRSTTGLCFRANAFCANAFCANAR
jgi:hypothetical protein